MDYSKIEEEKLDLSRNTADTETVDFLDSATSDEKQEEIQGERKKSVRIESRRLRFCVVKLSVE